MVGDEKAQELKTLKESGASNDEIIAKVDTLIAGMEDEDKKKKAEAVAQSCKVVFGVASRKMRRHEGHHDAWKSYLTWLTQEQKDELKTLKEGGADFDTLKKKVWEFYEAATGEVKTEATTKLQDACRGFIKKSVGDEKAAELKTLKESGATNEAMVAKVDELINSLGDPEMKAKAQAVADSCKVVFGVSSRRLRRNHANHEGHDDHEDHDHHDNWTKKYLNWLTQEQKDELKALKEGGATHESLRDKVMEYFEAAEGDVKKDAVTKMKEGCTAMMVAVVGQEKTDELKALKEGGATHSEMEAKANEFVGEVTDAHKKEMAGRYLGTCKKVYSSSANSRRRRNHPHEHEAWVNKYLSWMTEEQRAELKTLKESGASQDEMRSKVLAAYEATEGDKRTQATELLQSACRELLVSVVGPEKAAELKALKDGGATKDELSAKADEFLAEVTDEDKKTKVEHYGSSCKKIFAATSRRMRRNEDEKHANFVKEYLSWLTPEQQQELKDLRASGASKQNIKDKVMEYYNAADGDVKAEATTKLQGACRSLIVSMVGAEKAEELKTLKESGASKEALAEKVNELIAAIEDEDKKAQANEYSDTCRHIFGVAGRRRRAEVAESDVAKAHEAWAKKYLSWLTPEQIAELRTMHGNAASHEAIRDKIDEYFEAAEGDVKKEATEKLQDACRALIVKTVGAEKAAELKALKDGGATKDEIAAKVSELISGVEDESKKVEAERYKDSCQRILEASTSSRLRRDQHDAKHEEWAQKYLSWLTDEQRQELKALHEANDDHDQVRDKVIEFFEAAVGEVKAKATTELQSACRALIVSVMGPDQATELRQLKENGASKEELSAKAAEFIAAIQDPAKKTRAEQFSQTCKKIFGVTASRLRRGGGHHYDAWKEHLTWLTQEQKDELKSLKEGGADFDTLKNKVWEFYEASTGEVKTEATTKLQDACRHFIKKMVGDEKAQELKTLKESGASNDEIIAKVDTLIAGMEDEDKKKKAEAVAQSCKVVFGVASRKMRRHEGHHDAWKSYLTWLTQEQKDEIKALKEGGADFDTLKKKVW
uniref:Polyprotein allergen nematode domain-containing protein n=1 Tax=Plectus sambesii TaxID=2011161 RepID=A0A914XAY8_9BILA